MEFALTISADKVPDSLRLAERLARMMVGYALDGMECALTVTRVYDADEDRDDDAHESRDDLAGGEA